MRNGKLSNEDFSLLRSRTIDMEECDVDLGDPKWLDAYIVVKRNKIRKCINLIRLLNLAKTTDKCVYVINAEDEKARSHARVTTSLQRHLLLNDVHQEDEDNHP